MKMSSLKDRFRCTKMVIRAFMISRVSTRASRMLNLEGFGEITDLNKEFAQGLDQKLMTKILLFLTQSVMEGREQGCSTDIIASTAPILGRRSLKSLLGMSSTSGKFFCLQSKILTSRAILKS